jgi:hypothetical protein
MLAGQGYEDKFLTGTGRCFAMIEPRATGRSKVVASAPGLPGGSVDIVAGMHGAPPPVRADER